VGGCDVEKPEIAANEILEDLMQQKPHLDILKNGFVVMLF